MLANVELLRSALRLPIVRLVLAVHGALAVALSFLPLFDVLGFERAFVATLCSAPLSAVLAIALVRSHKDETEVGFGELASAAALIGAMSLLPTIGLGLLIELITQPCSPGQGLGFLLLGAGTGSLLGSAVGLLAACSRRWHGRPGWIVAAVFLLAAVQVGARLYQEPQIFAYSLFFGYWPGSLYDEEVRLGVALVAHRALAVCWAGFLFFVARAWLDPHTGGPRPRGVQPGSLLLAMIFAAGTATLSAHGEDLGFDLDRGTIDRVLSRRAEVDGIELRIDPSIHRDDLQRLLDELRLRRRQLEAFFGVAPTGIVAYVYRDQEQKRALMGAANTQIARPWHRELHVDGFLVPHPVLKHELAHVFAAELAVGPLRVPALGKILPNMGIIEGTAVAADWPAKTLTVHQWARAMRALNLAPDPRKALYPLSFWSQASGRAYTIAGSFLRHLVDTRGKERFAQLYRDNDFQAAYGVSLDTLVTEWESFIDAQPLKEEERVLAEHRFRDPGIFRRVCAHATAGLEQEAKRALDRGDITQAAERVERILRYDPGRVELLLGLARRAQTEGDLSTARALYLRAKDTSGVTRRLKAQATEAVADVAWLSGNREEATRGFVEVLSLHLSEEIDRLEQVKLEAGSRAPDVEAALRRYLTEDLPVPLGVALLSELAHAHPDDALVRYLYGKRLELIAAPKEAAAEIRVALALGLPTPALEREAKLTLGRSLLWAGEAAQAAAVFRAIAGEAVSAAAAIEARDWAERASLVAESRPRAGARGPTTAPE